MKKLLSFLVLILGMFLGGCATGRADSQATSPVTGYSGGALSGAEINVQRLDVRSGLILPERWDGWTPEQIVALIEAVGSTGHGFGDSLVSRQDIQGSAERGAGDTAASPTNAVDLGKALDAVNAALTVAGKPPIDPASLGIK